MEIPAKTPITAILRVVNHFVFIFFFLLSLRFFSDTVLRINKVNKKATIIRGSWLSLIIALII